MEVKLKAVFNYNINSIISVYNNKYIIQKWIFFSNHNINLWNIVKELETTIKSSIRE